MIDDGEMSRIKKQCRPPLFTYAHTSLVSASDDDENHHEKDEVNDRQGR